LSFSTVKSSRGAFEFSWATNKELWSFNTFVLTLGFLDVANANVEGKNVKCNMYSGNAYSYEFATIDVTDLATVTATPKTIGVADKFESSTKNFKFRCVGTLAPSVAALAKTDNIKVESKAQGSNVVYNYDVG